MKILLINPPTDNLIKTELPEFIRLDAGVLPPLGLMYIASYIMEFNPKHNIEILDTVAERMDRIEVKKFVSGFMPEVVGITAHTHNLLDVSLLVDDIKAVNPDIHIALGGPHVNIFPEESISMPGVDSVVIGEGEISFFELIESLSSKDNLGKVDGILFKSGMGYIRTKLRSREEDINNYPFPKREMLGNYRYKYALGSGQSRVTTMISSRGCPYSCIFCNTPKSIHRVRPPENIVAEMEECLRLGIEEIYFVDDVFGIDTNHILAVCDEIDKRNLIIKWGIRVRIDVLNKDLLHRLKKSGCYRVNLGVETSTDEGLMLFKKGISLKQIKEVFQWTQDANMATAAYFILGCPHERTRSDIDRTIDFAIDLNPDYAMFNLLALYPGTEVYNNAIREGIIRDNYWKDFVLSPSRNFLIPLWEKWFNRAELMSFLLKAYRKFYLRPKFVYSFLRNSGLKAGINNIKTGANILLGRG